MQTWRLILDGRYPSRENMERDLSLFDAVRRGVMDGCLRIYNWDTPAITVGYHQRAFVPYDRTLNLPILKRPTGGGAVLHIDDVTYSICAPQKGALAGGIRESYGLITQSFARALRHCGVSVSMDGADEGYDPVCFARTAAVELRLAGAKLMGAAQARREGCLIQQGVLPLRSDSTLYTRVFGPQSPPPAAILAHVKRFDLDEFVAVLRADLSEVMDIAWAPSERSSNISAPDDRLGGQPAPKLDNVPEPA